MTETPDGSLPSTPESVKAVAQTNETATADPVAAKSSAPCPGEGTTFVIGEGVERAVDGRPEERNNDQPIYRPLKIFALDPSVSRLEGATALVNVPYEPLEAGPVGHLFSVGEAPGNENQSHHPLNLEDPNILIRSGIEPSTSDKRFHEQMVYAVCSIVYTAFRRALGRHIAWGFNKLDDKHTRLLIIPRAFEGTNSCYDKTTGELRFGYYKSKAKDFPGTVYACLSHDTVAHEVTHALLDGLRAHFSLPTSPDVLAFHEGFADLVAVFQHFSYEQVVRTAIRKSRGAVSRAALLTDIARQLGQTGRAGKTALRSAIDFTEEADPVGEKPDGTKEEKGPRLYDPAMEPHDLGSVLVFSVFEAFITVFRRKTERLLRLATNGSGRLPPGEIPLDLQAALAEKASKLAGQFLTMCIRAIDYCPPVDITLGEYLRAVITSDKDLVPDDPWAYREAWVDAFRHHRIYPSWVEDLSEDALTWLAPQKHDPPLVIPQIEGLTFTKLKFDGDPAWPADKTELKRQACALGEIVTRPEYLHIFGLAAKDDELLNGDKVELPEVQSIRSSRRIGPSGQVVFDIVAEVTQRRMARNKESGEVYNFYGGATIIIDPNGKIRYVMAKRVTNNERLDEQKQFLESQNGARYKESLSATATSRPNLFMMLHQDVPPVT
ncbi:MAG: peptidase M4 [Pyrinomonadaceae bacterium]|nr:peptidase M4 [Pyrinomonadaceae bacterium]